MVSNLLSVHAQRVLNGWPRRFYAGAALAPETSLHPASALRRLGCIALLCLCIVAQQAGAAVRPVDLFTIDMPAQTRAADERSTLAAQALEHVYTRITGDSQATAKFPELRSSLANANRYIASYQYQQLDSANDQLPSLLLTLVFDSAAITQRLSAAGAPFWQSQRPVVALWLVEQRGNQRVFVTAKSAPVLYQALLRHAALRGLPLEIPAQVLGSSAGLSTREAWNLSDTAVINAARRNAADIILVGKVAPSGAGWLGQWKSYQAGAIQSRRIDASHVDGVASAGIDALASRLASRFAVQPGSQQQGSSYVVSIDNLRAQSDYLQLIEYLENFKGFSQIQILDIVGQRARFSVDFSGSAAKARSLLLLNRHLSALDYADELAFAWQR